MPRTQLESAHLGIVLLSVIIRSTRVPAVLEHRLRVIIVGVSFFSGARFLKVQSSRKVN